MKPFIRILYRDFTFHPLLWFLSILGVGIGVGGWVGMDLATNHAIRSLRTSVESTVGKATHVIEDRTGMMKEERYRVLSEHFSITMTPLLEGAGEILAEDGEATGPVRITGVDPYTYDQFRSEEIRGGKFLSTIPFLGKIRGVILPSSMRDRYSRGSIVRLYTGKDTVSYQVMGFVETSGDRVVIVPLHVAQEDLDRKGEITRILIRHEGKLPPLEERLAPTEVIIPAGIRSRSILSLVSSFRWNLRALAFLSLFVGAFLVYCSMVLYQSRQKKTFSLLRTLGVSSSEIFWLSLATVIILSFSGTILGIFLGLGFGGILEGDILRTVNQLYVSVYADSGDNLYTTLLTGVIFGTGVSLVGGVEPAIRNWNIPPRSWNRSFGPGRAKLSIPWLLSWILIFFLLALLLVLMTEESLLAGFISCFFVALAGAGFGILLLKLGARTLDVGVLNRIAVRNLNRYGKRISVTAATLTISFSMVLAVLLMVSSFRKSVNSWVQSVVRADYYIRTVPLEFKGEGRSFSPEALSDLRNIRGIGGVGILARKTVYSRNQKPIHLRGIEPEFWKKQAPSLFTFNPPVENPWDRLDSGAVILSEPGAYRMEKSVGDQISLPGGSKTWEHLKIAGVFNDYSTEWAIVYLDIDKMRSLYKDITVRDVAIFKRDQTDQDRFQKDLNHFVSERGYYIQSGIDMRRRALENFDQTFAVTDVMNGIASVIAVVGLIVTFVALYRIRRREVGLLRAIGLTRWRTGTLFSLEMFYLALYTAVASIPTGLILSYLLIYVVNRRSFGWMIEYHMSVDSIGWVLGLIGASSLLALLVPWWNLQSDRLSDLLQMTDE